MYLQFVLNRIAVDTLWLKMSTEDFITQNKIPLYKGVEIDQSSTSSEKIFSNLCR